MRKKYLSKLVIAGFVLINIYRLDASGPRSHVEYSTVADSLEAGLFLAILL